MKVVITVTGADVAEFSGEITRPDYPIVFDGVVGECSVDSLAQSVGSKRWEDMHGETPTNVYYTSEYPA